MNAATNRTAATATATVATAVYHCNDCRKEVDFVYNHSGGEGESVVCSSCGGCNVYEGPYSPHVVSCSCGWVGEVGDLVYHRKEGEVAGSLVCPSCGEGEGSLK